MNEHWKSLLRAFATINAEEDVPTQQIIIGAKNAAKAYWTEYYTEKRQAELEACKKVIKRCPHLKKNPRMEAHPERDNYDRVYPAIQKNERNFQSPKKITKQKRLLKIDSITDIIETCTKRSATRR
ncbi:hypothetical protein JTB14_012895 [Gonioctena quinquepunctata]|nr:hypothetical protein JTB14_012895 [Gonioctena quinquepunctata]